MRWWLWLFTAFNCPLSPSPLTPIVRTLRSTLHDMNARTATGRWDESARGRGEMPGQGTEKASAHRCCAPHLVVTVWRLPTLLSRTRNTVRVGAEGVAKTPMCVHLAPRRWVELCGDDGDKTWHGPRDDSNSRSHRGHRRGEDGSDPWVCESECVSE
jgi:hypothetical protein